MEQRYFLIIPGAGDPDHELNKDSYYYIKEEALKRGFTKVIVIKTPGHESYSDETLYLNQKKSAELLSAELKKYDELNIKCSIFTRSYGCGILLRSILENSFGNIENIKMWGAIPYLSLYNVILGAPNNISKAKNKGCLLNHDSFYSCDPIELQIMKYKGDVPLNIGVGSLDKHSKLSFYNYVIDYTPDKQNVKYSIVNGLGHVIEGYNKKYLDFIFNK